MEKNIQEGNTDTLNCPLHVSDLLPGTKPIFNKLLYNVIHNTIVQSPVNGQIHWEREFLNFKIYWEKVYTLIYKMHIHLRLGTFF